MNEITKVQPAVITFDYPNAQQILDEMLKPWKGITPENADQIDIKQARASRAELNKMKKQLEDARKKVKREVNVPYDEFAEQIKSLVSTIDQYCSVLDESVKRREQQFRDERYAVLSQEFRDFAPFLTHVIKLDQFLEKEWLNKTMSERRAIHEMQAKLVDIVNDYDTLRNMEGKLEFYDEDKAVFFETLSLKQALDHENARKEQVRRIATMESYHNSYDCGELVDQSVRDGWIAYEITLACDPVTLEEIAKRPDVEIIAIKEATDDRQG